ncbi:hypothetical protein HR45_03740 [Shewanella mangrovi]|uniref:Uncharacterized protein n=1 Tax=Shewanella mangrovi TaxID=1515746 RepID=A0A094LTL4_9GAMM|nr:hypothetical protein [Shewanella mangrovi]KFZ38548.1 hypothetical protein HR45_03740 [Shewanella mangrovi]
MLGWTLFVGTVVLLITPVAFDVSSFTLLNSISLETIMGLLITAYALNLLLNSQLKDAAVCR